MLFWFTGQYVVAQETSTGKKQQTEDQSKPFIPGQFVDENKDGVCDHLDGTKRAYGKHYKGNKGYGQGYYGNGNKHRHGYHGNGYCRWNQ